MQPLLILGTHHFAPEMYDLIDDVPGFRVDGFVENLDRKRSQHAIEDKPVYWIDDVGRFADTHKAVCALLTPTRSRIVEEAAARGLAFATIIHPAARVSARSTLGDGTFVSAGAVVATRTRIGSHVIVNRGALIGHDVRIGDFVTISPGANVAALCRIGPGAYVAPGAVVVDRITIGEGAFIAAGAVVVEDVEPNTRVLGVPARVG